MPVRIGTSFSPRRCSWFGLDARSTFPEMLDIGFRLVRVSAHWDEISESGYAELDRLLDTANAAGVSILLTVGMKAIHWPEFYLPTAVRPDPGRRGTIGRERRFGDAVVRFVSDTVARYRDRREIVGWQVENEPFNRSGPRRWWIDPGLVRREIDAVRALDGRPIVVNAFAHFDAAIDAESRPRRGFCGLRRLVPENLILDLIGGTGILGLDVYTAIGAEVAGAKTVHRAEPNRGLAAGRWLRAAQRKGGSAWIIECQAEPWEASRDTLAEPLSLAPPDVPALYDELVGAGFTTVLLWGCEYWLWRAAAGDRRWVEAAARIAGPT